MSIYTTLVVDTQVEEESLTIVGSLELSSTRNRVPKINVVGSNIKENGC